MPKPSSIEKNEVARAIIQLRGSFQETQEAFARRVGVALNTVQRWELNDPPQRRYLKKLIEYAYDKDRRDLAAIFYIPFRKDIDPNEAGVHAQRIRETIRFIQGLHSSIPPPKDKEFRKRWIAMSDLLKGLEAEIAEFDFPWVAKAMVRSENKK
jgi:transcriptional regulator with XRE-family HTH domain